MKLEELERVFNDNNEPYEILEITLTMENVHKSPQSMDIDDEDDDSPIPNTDIP